MKKNMRGGFIATYSVLVVLAVVASVATVTTYLAVGNAKGSLSFAKGVDALGFAEGCVEDGLLKARAAATFGDPVGTIVTVTRPEGTCQLTVDSKVGEVWTMTVTNFVPTPTIAATPTPSNTPTPSPTLAPTATPAPWPTPTPNGPTPTAGPTCVMRNVSTPLTDLGGGEYMRLTTINPETYTATGVIGGLYPGGVNIRPGIHKTDGLAAAASIQPLDATGVPDGEGLIGMTSIGMSNTSTEFGVFKSLADADSQKNSKVKIANGALSGSVVEVWTDPLNNNFNYAWNTHLPQQITQAGLTNAQVQVAWIKVTQFAYQPDFPAAMVNLKGMYEELARLLKARFPNLRITYFSSRTRSFSYLGGLSGESTAFENAFAVRWMIEDQMNGLGNVNFNPNNGPVVASYITWGPYLWIDGENARGDGRTWPANSVVSDCTHPSTWGSTMVADMLTQHFKTDETAAPWYLAAPGGTPSPTPTPTAAPTPTPAPYVSVQNQRTIRVIFNRTGSGLTLTSWQEL